MTQFIDENTPEESDPDIELLTSYLDGELDDDETSAVEQRIATDPTFRLQMQKLQRTWDLLESLPSEAAAPSFTRTTMEMVVDDAMSEIRSRERLQDGAAWKRPLKMLAMIVVPIAICAGSFLAARQVQRENQQRLVEIDLPVIERSDHYMAIDQDLEFLVSLHNSGLFSDETALYSAERDELAPKPLSDSTPSISAGVAPLDPFARLEAMDADQRDSVRRKREKFDKMATEQQDSLRQFHDQFTSHEKSKELHETLSDYFGWLGTLPSRDRAELADMPTDDRMSEIARTLITRASQEFGRSGITQLPPEDARAVFDWYEKVVKKNGKKIRRLYKNVVRKRNQDALFVVRNDRLDKLTKRPLNQLVGVLIQVDRESIKEMLYTEINSLSPKLSQEAREILESKPANGQQQLLLNWTEAANQTRSKVTIVQLQKFFEQLSTEQRDELDEMSFENWEQTLTRLYRQNRLSRSTESNNLSDEQSVQSLVEASGLEVPDQPEEDFEITIEDMGILLNLGTGFNLDDLIGPEGELAVPDGPADDASSDDP